MSTLRKKSSRPVVQNDLEVFTASLTKSAPEPCKSCGKPDQPERFHSHPKSSQLKPKDNPTNSKSKTTIPKTVQKPVALNFRSDKNKNKVEEIVVQNHSNNLHEKSNASNNTPSSAPIKKGPRTITCYICGREFGTASFPIHEPRCMQVSNERTILILFFFRAFKSYNFFLITFKIQVVFHANIFPITCLLSLKSLYRCEVSFY